jgi:hypothetical protein
MAGKVSRADRTGDEARQDQAFLGSHIAMCGAPLTTESVRAALGYREGPGDGGPAAMKVRGRVRFPILHLP